MEKQADNASAGQEKSDQLGLWPDFEVIKFAV